MTSTYILGNKDRESKVDENLYKKLNKLYKKEEEIINVPNSRENILDNKLFYNKNGTPKLKLKSLEKIVINVLTQKEYDILMQVYESADWKWLGGNFATQKNIWSTNTFNTLAMSTYSEKTCIEIQNLFRYSDKDYYQTNDYFITSPKEFYDIQKISQDTIKELSDWYDKNKPDRASKG